MSVSVSQPHVSTRELAWASTRECDEDIMEPLAELAADRVAERRFPDSRRSSLNAVGDCGRQARMDGVRGRFEGSQKSNEVVVARRRQARAQSDEIERRIDRRVADDPCEVLYPG